MKKFLLFLLSLTMLICVFSQTVSASAGNFDVSVAKVEGMPGSEVEVVVSVSNNPGVAFFAATLQYDTTALELVGVTNGSVIKDMDSGTNLIWSADDDSTTTGTLVTLKFKILTSSAGKYDIRLIGRECYGMINDVNFSISNGTVTVSCSHTNTQDVPETPAKCNEIGYTAGVYCNDCKTYISGHTEVPATGNHTDADGKWESDGTNHWHTCSCGKVIDKAACAGGTATCKAKAACSTCGNEWGTLGSHNYDTSVYGYKVAEGHAHLCEACGSHDDVVAHTPDRDNATCLNDKACGTCGYVLESALGHDYSEKLEDAAHLKTKAAKCTEYNTYWYDCSRCEANAKDDAKASAKFYTSTVAGDHSFTEKLADEDHLVVGSGVTCKDAKKYYYDCSYCHLMGTEIWTSTEFGPHDYDTSVWGYANKEEGHAHKCKNCDAHDTLQQHVPGPDATEDNHQICTDCKVVLVPATGHLCSKHLAEKAANPATCTSSGNKAYYECSCGNYYEDAEAKTQITDKESVIISALGHNYSEMLKDESHLKAKATNCTQYDTYWYDCSRCDANAKDDAAASEKYYNDTVVGTHDFSEMLEDADHLVSGTGINCQSACEYYYDCEYCTEKSTEKTWKSETYGKHEISKDWQNANGYHWQKCGIEGCDHTTEKVKCDGGTVTCLAKAVCTTCGKEYGELADHTLTTYTQENDNHYRKCDVNGCEYAETPVECAGGTPTCYAKAICSTCKNTYGSTLDHNYSTEYSAVEGGHAYKCTNDGCVATTEPEPHVDDENKEKCTVCNYIYHTCGVDMTLFVGIPATCTSAGRKAYYECSCGLLYTDAAAKNPVNADALVIMPTHTFFPYPGKAPTCTEDGFTSFAACTTCGFTLQPAKTIPATGHTPADTVKENVVEATEAMDGSYDTVVYCTVCGDEVSRETTVIPATGVETTEPEATEPEVTEPEVTEPEVTEPEVTEPEVTEPEVTEPEVTEPEVTEPEVTEPEVTEPEVTEPEVTEPEVTEPEVTEPEVTEPEVTEPEVTEPEVTEPSNPKTSDNAVFYIIAFAAVALISIAIVCCKKREE